MWSSLTNSSQIWTNECPTYVYRCRIFRFLWFYPSNILCKNSCKYKLEEKLFVCFRFSTSWRFVCGWSASIRPWPPGIPKLIKWPDKSTTSYYLLHFVSEIKKFVMDISANSTFNFAKVCLGFATYDVILPDIYLTNFLYLF